MRWLWLLLAIGLCLIPIEVGAQPPSSDSDVVVTASGYIVGAPEGFTVWYISDYEVGISWTKPLNAENTLIRVKYGSPPEDREDGYLVYYGTNSSYIDYNVQLLGPEIPYFAAWSETATGQWDIIGTSGGADFMAISFLFIGLLILGISLFLASFRWKDMLLSYAAALTWMAMGFWWIIGDITNFGLSDPWTQILVVVPFVLAFTVLLRLMNVEIVNESKGRRWTEFGATPKDDKPDRRTEYRDLLRARIR